MPGIFICLSLFILSCASVDSYSRNYNPLQISARRSLLSLSKYDRLYQQESTVIHANIGKTYNATVNSSVEIIFEINYQEFANKTTAVRISTELMSGFTSLEHYPLLVVVRQQEAIQSWKLPMPLEDIYTYEKVSRTLCPLDKSHRQLMSPNQTLYVDVTTMYPIGNVQFSFSADIVQNLIIRTNESKAVALSVSEPEYYMFTFPEDVDSVIIHAMSEDTLCTIMSIQDVTCPVYDQHRDVKFQGKYQTMSKQAAITVVKDDYKEKSFYVVFVLKPSDLDCQGIETIHPPGYERIKHLTVSVTGTISATSYYLAVLAAVFFFVLFYTSAFFIGVFYHGCAKNRGIWMQVPQTTDDDSASSLISPASTPTSYGAVSNSDSVRSDKELGVVPRHTVHPVGPSVSPDDVSSIDSDEIDFLLDADSDKEVIRTKTVVCVSDLSRKKYKREHKKYTLYWRNLIAVSIFYGLPVLQLVFTYQRVLNVTGDLDICYYNFNCAHPLGPVTSFNNVFSNIGYVLLGILFIILVWRRNIIYNKAVSQDRAIKKEYGIPQHYGLFYGMGLALIMEGIMSACYHICPNYSNFQFDTSFMYIIACLCMLKIYQTRHPDISAKAHTSYLIMALVIFIAVIGVIYSSSIFWILFAVADMTFYLVLSINIYYMGRWKIDRGICHRLCLMLRYDIFRKPLYLDRLVLLSLGTILNWGLKMYGFAKLKGVPSQLMWPVKIISVQEEVALIYSNSDEACAIYGAVKEPSDFASFLLAIFIGNLLLYCTFYIIMKLRHKERIHFLTVGCILTAAVVWVLALYFFFAHLTSWQETPAVSREGNRNCIVLNFYDAHDVWHMMSAIALFFSFLILLTIDDDLFAIKREKILVF